AHVRRPGGRERERGQRRAVHARDLRDVGEVVEPRQVSVLHAVLDAHVLVLVFVVLVRLGEAHRRVAVLEERDVVAAAQVSVAPVDRPDAKAGQVLLSRLLDEARELARLRVVLAADAATRGRLLRRLARRHALGEDAHRAVVADAALARGAADDVVGEHGVHVHALLLRLLGAVGRADEALLFARDRYEDDRRVELPPGHDARKLQHRRRPRSVVVRARRVAGGVGRVRADRVVVAADDVDPVLRLGLRARKRRHHVRQPRGFLYALEAPGLLLEGLQLDFQTTAGVAAVALHLLVNPVACGADAARRVVLRRER